MKVLHVINTLSVGGAERHLLTLSRELRRRGVEVTVACLRETVPGSRSLRPEFEREGAKAMSDIGRVMKDVLPEVRGRADGGAINAAARKILQGT